MPPVEECPDTADDGAAGTAVTEAFAPAWKLAELLREALQVHEREVAALQAEITYLRHAPAASVGGFGPQISHKWPTQSGGDDLITLHSDSWTELNKASSEKDQEGATAKEGDPTASKCSRCEDTAAKEEAQSRRGSGSSAPPMPRNISFNSEAYSFATESRSHGLAKKSSGITPLFGLGTHVQDTSTPLERFVNGPFDRVCSLAIMLNVVFVFVQLQYQGYSSAVKVGLSSRNEIPLDSGGVFHILEHVFNAYFTLELLLRISVFRTRFFWDEDGIQKYNMFDAFLVLATCVDLALGEGAGGINLNVLRPFRFLRLVRTLRVLQSVRLLEKLKVLVNTVFVSFMALFWSILLLTIVMLMASLFLCQSLTTSLEDEGLHMDTKIWIFKMYGTATRSFYTVFELTFSGGWPNYARLLVEEVHPAYALFFYVYIIAVVFAMFRIITALFLRDTMAVAASDAETAVQEKMKQRKKYAAQLLEFFQLADTSNDGFLALPEFQEILACEKVKTWLSIMEIDVSETTEFFELLAEEDGLVSPDEFVAGILRLKGGARSQDVMALMRSSDKMGKELEYLLRTCDDISRTCSELARSSIPNGKR